MLISELDLTVKFGPYECVDWSSDSEEICMKGIPQILTESCRPAVKAVVGGISDR
jgi:hypothetical protein